MSTLKLEFYLFLFFLTSSLYSQSSTGHIFSNKMTDIEGKQYDVIKIGEISWVQRNLDVARFRNGDLIKNAAVKKIGLKRERMNNRLGVIMKMTLPKVKFTGSYIIGMQLMIQEGYVQRDGTCLVF
jgi:hypothetical protein